MEHDIHQYYFERYLRNEMSAKDRLSFEEKMSADMALRQAFAKYKANRTAHLENLVREHEFSRRTNRINSFIYLLISLAGIALAVNFYLDNRALRKSQSQYQADRKVRLWGRIPFLNPEKVEIYQPKPPPIPPVKKEIQPIEETTEGSDTTEIQDEETEELAFVTDVLLHDTFMVAMHRNEIARLRILTEITDSLVSDSSLRKNMKTGKKTLHHFFVEFWQSPVNYRGYKFNGKKIMVYGIQEPDKVYLVIEGDHIILLDLDTNTETLLIKDNDFHKL